MLHVYMQFLDILYFRIHSAKIKLMEDILSISSSCRQSSEVIYNIYIYMFGEQVSEKWSDRRNCIAMIRAEWM